MKSIIFTNGYAKYGFRTINNSTAQKIICEVELYFIAGKSNFARIALSSSNKEIGKHIKGIILAEDPIEYKESHKYLDDIKCIMPNEFEDATVSEIELILKNEGVSTRIEILQMCYSDAASSNTTFRIAAYAAVKAILRFLDGRSISDKEFTELLSSKRSFTVVDS